MSRDKCLFLFAGYDQESIIDDAMVYYVSCLSKHGDVIVCMDNDLKKNRNPKIKTLYNSYDCTKTR